MPDKLKLAILELKEIQKGQRKDGKGEWQKLSFKAKEGDAEHWYSSLSPSLFPSIIVGQIVEADVTISETDRGTERKVTQIYVGGQPVAARFEPGGRSYQRPDDSPEKRRSIETQSAFQGVIQLMVAGILKPDTPLATGALHWAEERLAERPLNTPVNGSVAVPIKGSLPTGPKAEAKPEAKPEAKDFLPENVGQMFWYAKTKGKSHTEVLAFLGETDPVAIKVDVAWPKVKAWLEKGK